LRTSGCLCITEWDDLLRLDESTSPLLDYDQRSIETTWAIFSKAIEARNGSAAKLLWLWAFLDNKEPWHGFPREALAHGRDWPDWISDMACKEVTFMNAVRLLLSYLTIEALEST
jgi:hypothetical protein